ncbi:hypothetical protein [Humisphaera borealis]|uniref:Secretin/TonB short N-terminal domain-containing protein n=1 Tax=Humisphaera borealis TaxID=2807512 RepID=A0A7M2WTT7_9BACT|nr:hypothetical protein [Humisphaera borealis]QOV88935.1 hypothetical protein IPV69_22325 [Humisphaera borealis]
MRFARRAIALAVVAGLVTVLPPSTSDVSAQARPTQGVAKGAMSRRLPDVKLQNVSLGDAIEFIRDVSGANVTVNWRALEAAGVSKETPINVRLNGVSLRKVLATVLNEAGAGTGLTYIVDEDVIEITTQAIADQKMYMRIYPIEDLLLEIPNFDNVPDFSLESTTSNQGGGQGGGGGGGGGGLLGGGNSQKEKEVVKTRQEKADEIIKLITETIRPEVWRDNGGTASIRFFQGSLIVLAPLSVHEMIGG